MVLVATLSLLALSWFAANVIGIIFHLRQPKESEPPSKLAWVAWAVVFFSMWLGPCSALGVPTGLVLGFVELSRVKRGASPERGRYLARTAIVSGLLGLVCIATAASLTFFVR